MARGVARPVRYRGRLYRSCAALADSIGVSRPAVHHIARRWRCDQEAFDKHLDDMLYRRRRGVAPCIRVYSRVKDGVRQRLLVQDVIDRTGMPKWEASRNLRLWEQEVIDDPCDRAAARLAAGNKRGPARGAGEWQGLSNRVRSHRLEYIPGPTKYERRLYGERS